MRAAIVMVAVLLAGCENHDGEVCVESHQQLIMTPIIVGKTTTMMPNWITVCDRWAPA